MKLHKLFSLITAFLIISCTSKNEVDLLKLKLPIPENVMVNDMFKTELLGPTKVIEGYNVHMSKDPKLLFLNDESLSGSLTENSDLFINNIEFYVQNENKHIGVINLNTFTTKTTELLHEILLDKFDEPNYYESASNISHSIWEDENSNNTIIFSHKYDENIRDIDTEIGSLYILDKKI
ncbi:hypothetical protein M601_003005 [Cellulophaga baltica 4]|nr:hypothetical protein M601_003005 [Cellulophaga baltica 4]